jgi:hypothetical protein
MYFVAAHRHRAGAPIGRPEKKSLATSVANPARLRHLPTARITVSAGRRSNAEYRKREHLTAAEIDKLIEAAKGNRHGHRDATMILVATVMASGPLNYANYGGKTSISGAPR